MGAAKQTAHTNLVERQRRSARKSPGAERRSGTYAGQNGVESRGRRRRDSGQHEGGGATTRPTAAQCH